MTVLTPAQRLFLAKSVSNNNLTVLYYAYNWQSVHSERPR